LNGLIERIAVAHERAGGCCAADSLDPPSQGHDRAAHRLFDGRGARGHRFDRQRPLVAMGPGRRRDDYGDQSARRGVDGYASLGNPGRHRGSRIGWWVDPAERRKQGRTPGGPLGRILAEHALDE
jgi:hypothetical protein